MNVSANLGGAKAGLIGTTIFSAYVTYVAVVPGELSLFVGQLVFVTIGIAGLSILALWQSRSDECSQTPKADTDSALKQQLQTQAATLTAISQQLKEDIRQRQQAEDQLSSILDNLGDAVWSISPRTGEFIYLNPAARSHIEEICGEAGAKILGNPHLWLGAIAPEDRKRYKATQRSLRTRGSWDLEYRIIQPNGRVRWLRDRARLVCDRAGIPLRIDGTITDITSHKQAEEQCGDNFDSAIAALPNQDLFCKICDLHPSTNSWGQPKLEAELWRAIERRELQLFYQPIVNLRTGKIQGFEALSRWHHPQRGWVSPAKFIPLAEATGAIFSLGQWVLQAACEQMQRWQFQGLLDDQTSINVNVSGKQFARHNIVEIVTQVLAQTGLDARRLRLEIVEDAICGDVCETIAQLQQLRSLGVQLAIDDFGVGCSSLSRLHRFPITSLKIDRSFINLLGSGDREIVKTIINLGANLGMQVVAEGIETKEQVKQLQQLGCHCGQGYWFARPSHSEAIPAMLRQDRAAPELISALTSPA